MKSEIKVGDRVRAYGGDGHVDGTVLKVDGEVLTVDTYEGTVHRKQCRRLKSKQPKEFWIVMHDALNEEYDAYTSRELAERNCDWDAQVDGIIHVREVRAT